MVKIEISPRTPRPGTKLYNIYPEDDQNPGFAEEFEVDEKYEVTDLLGCGGYGAVVAAIDKSTGLEVAIKKIVRITSEYFLSQKAIREMKILNELRHPFIIELKAVMVPAHKKTFSHLYVVMERMNTNLNMLIKRANEESVKIPNFHIKLIMNQILRGLQYTHASNVLHRDLKTRNILINGLRIKIADFGESRQESKEMTRLVGTPQYTPPEVFLNMDDFIAYGKSIDVWCLGSLFAELLHPQDPQCFNITRGAGQEFINFHEIAKIVAPPDNDEELASFIESETMRLFAKKMLPHAPSELLSQKFGDVDDKNAVDLLEKMLLFNPHKRITVSEALQHEYMKDITLDVLERELDLDDVEVEQLKSINPPDFQIDEDKIENSTMAELADMLYNLSIDLSVGSRKNSNVGITIEEMKDSNVDITHEEVGNSNVGITFEEAEDSKVCIISEEDEDFNISRTSDEEDDSNADITNEEDSAMSTKSVEDEEDFHGCITSEEEDEDFRRCRRCMTSEEEDEDFIASEEEDEDFVTREEEDDSSFEVSITSEEEDDSSFEVSITSEEEGDDSSEVGITTVEEVQDSNLGISIEEGEDSNVSTTSEEKDESNLGFKTQDSNVSTTSEKKDESKLGSKTEKWDFVPLANS